MTATTPLSVAERISRPHAWASIIDARGMSISANAVGPSCSRRGTQQGVVGPWERDPIDDHERERLAGYVDALEQTGGGEQAGLGALREGLDQGGLRQITLGQDRVVDPVAQCVGGFVHRSVAGEQRQCAPPGCGDQRFEFVVDRRPEPLAVRIGQVHRAIEHRVVLVVERAAHIGDHHVVTGDTDTSGERRRNRRAREDRRSL